MYGQTTSGKTYTMLGNETTEGLILYSLKHIFGKVPPQTSLKISYLEIYNEQINDLLKEGSVNLKIVDESVMGLSQCPVSNI
jgi:centromeric protein E